MLASAADSADVTITLDDVDGADAWGDTPRVRIGHLIRIGDELLRVTAIAGDMLTVRRGENGTAPSITQPMRRSCAMCRRIKRRASRSGWRRGCTAKVKGNTAAHGRRASTAVWRICVV
ncbi:MAG: hypothetical protein HND48_23070 [Chloroflexi bacterium]|nr:hypothetical protein [Chloroflexota bacterium]